jgi:hypothetical protein
VVSSSNTDGKASAAAAAEDRPQSADPDARDPLTETEGLDLIGILSSIEETAYVWDIKTGRLEWEQRS